MYGGIDANGDYLIEINILGDGIDSYVDHELFLNSDIDSDNDMGNLNFNKIEASIVPGLHVKRIHLYKLDGAKINNL